MSRWNLVARGVDNSQSGRDNFGGCNGFYLEAGKNRKAALEEAKNYAKLIGKLI